MIAKIIGMSTVSVVDLVDQTNQLKIWTHEFTLWPQRWQTYARNHEWIGQKLEEVNAKRIPTCPGIYTLVVQPGIAGHNACSYLLYVGQTVSLRRRFGEYLRRERLQVVRPKMTYFLN